MKKSPKRSSRPRVLALAASLVLLGAAPYVRGDLDPARLETWKLPEASLYAVTVRGQNAWAVGYWGTILHSSDGGRSWSQPDSPTAKTLFGISFADDKTGWAVGADGTILRSSDGGDSWTAQAVELNKAQYALLRSIGGLRESDLPAGGRP